MYKWFYEEDICKCLLNEIGTKTKLFFLTSIDFRFTNKKILDISPLSLYDFFHAII